MDLIDRYVYAVIKSLPEKQREDIEKELRSLIDEMLDQYQESGSCEENVQKVLLELGDPDALADNYRGSKRYLIGPKYFEQYVLILKIVLGAVFGGVSIAFLFQSFLPKETTIPGVVIDYVTSVFYGLLQAFAWTTLAFVLAERNNMNTSKDTSIKKVWNPSHLQAVPNKKALIPVSEPIVSMIFGAIFMVLLYTAPGLFSVYISSNSGMTIIPILNLDVIQEFKAVIIFIFILGILKDALKLFFRRWTMKLAAASIVLTAISTVLAVVMLMNNNIWNADFPQQTIQHMHLTFDFAYVWEKIKSVFMVIVVLAGAIEIISTLVKGIRYDMPSLNQFIKK